MCKYNLPRLEAETSHSDAVPALMMHQKCAIYITIISLDARPPDSLATKLPPPQWTNNNHKHPPHRVVTDCQTQILYLQYGDAHHQVSLHGTSRRDTVGHDRPVSTDATTITADRQHRPPAPTTPTAATADTLAADRFWCHLL